MSVTGKKIGRLDIRLVRGDSQRVGVRWRQRNVRTGQVGEVDVSQGWSAQLLVQSPDGQETWLSLPCGVMTADGLVACDIPVAAFTPAVWNVRHTGRWKIVVSHRAHRQTLAWGYWTLSE